MNTFIVDSDLHRCFPVIQISRSVMNKHHPNHHQLGSTVSLTKDFTHHHYQPTTTPFHHHLSLCHSLSLSTTITPPPQITTAPTTTAKPKSPLHINHHC
ncbi:hypothetical protein HanXRQr2_Chr16g0739401 [Helianthus annuus]|uniref:Uncharacterized protein n=1 Tax=Helianthus annuus TaxID=4232 RepID=A0A9K3DQ00_HELAN|nr:hypothetical protein HanXRQr2_Chr16g0739401 [Helianthus annuus]